jgi:hypothetical protein
LTNEATPIEIPRSKYCLGPRPVELRRNRSQTKAVANAKNIESGIKCAAYMETGPTITVPEKKRLTLKPRKRRAIK